MTMAQFVQPRRPASSWRTRWLATAFWFVVGVERTAAAFAVRLRDDVDLASVQGDLLGVVAGRLQPASVAVWTRSQPDGVR